MRSLLVARPYAVATVVMVAIALAQALVVLPGRAHYEWRLTRQREPGQQPAVLAPLRRYFPGTNFFVRALAEIPPRASYAVSSKGDALRLAAPYVLLPRREVPASSATWILSNEGTPPNLGRRVVRRIPLGDGVELLEVRR